MNKQDFASVGTSSRSKFEDSDDDDDVSSEDERELERELAEEVTFGELQRAKSDGSETLYRKFDSGKKVAGRANKNRPVEMSSKKPVSRFREVIQVPRKVVRDPRFETLCGKFDAEGFQKRYSFLYQNVLPSEKEEIKKQLKKSNDPVVVDELKNRLGWIDKQQKSVVTKRTDKDILAEHKKREKEAAKQGKRPYYLKKSEIRKLKLIEKYNELKAAGKLESFMEKKRRKNAAKDHRYMPYRRSNEGGQ